MSPQEDRIGRCCKVGKETIFALLKALEIFVNQDYEQTLKTFDERAQVISAAIAKFGVTARPREFNPEALGNVTPYYSWHIDQTKVNITGPEVMQQLADTRPMGIGSMGANASGMRGRNPEPPGAATGSGAGTRPTADVPKREHQREHPKDPDTFGFAVWQLKDGEDKIIADRLVEIFSSAKKA
jgi:hypothetical protein